jgi:hypothetical protein
VRFRSSSSGTVASGIKPACANNAFGREVECLGAIDFTPEPRARQPPLHICHCARMNEPRRCLLFADSSDIAVLPSSGRWVPRRPSPNIAQADLPDVPVVTQAPARNLCVRKQFGGEVETAGQSRLARRAKQRHWGSRTRHEAPTTTRQRKHGAVECRASGRRRDAGRGVDDLAVMIYLWV